MARDKDPMQKKHKRDYQKNVTEKNKQKCLMKQQALGVLGVGTIIGIDEAILTNSEAYTTTIVCKRYDKNMNNAQLYRMDAQQFRAKVQGNGTT